MRNSKIQCVRSRRRVVDGERHQPDCVPFDGLRGRDPVELSRHPTLPQLSPWAQQEDSS
jgi:hypothetical protein